jgi:hypothetical protein
MSDDNLTDWSPARKINAIRQDDEFFRRNTFGEEQARDLFMYIVLENHLRDEHLEALLAFGCALRGTHPYMSLEVRLVPDGVTPRPLMEIRKGALAMKVADQIDMQVAHGVKQDAVIQEVIEETGISRREIFRMLKLARQHRVILKTQEAELADWACWYEGYDIAPDGTLVPTTPA